MKAFGCVVLVVVVAVGGFAALAGWLLLHGDDQSALSERVGVTVRPLEACVDPDAPSQHVITVNQSCGEEQIRGLVKEGTPRSAP